MSYKNIIPYMGQMRDKELKGSEEYQLINLTGFQNYTPEKLKKLREMFKAKKITSFPRMIDGSYYWMDKLNSNSYDNVMRDNDLPSVEEKDGDDYVQEWHNRTSEERRETGPSRIIFDSNGNPIKYFWSGGGMDLMADLVNQKFRTGNKSVTKQKYLEAIKKHYPNAKSAYEL